jgi:hypothetical protein
MSGTVRLGLILPQLPENLYGDQGYNPLLTRTGYLRRVKYWLPAFLGVIVLLTTMGCVRSGRERGFCRESPRLEGPFPTTPAPGSLSIPAATQKAV